MSTFIFADVETTGVRPTDKIVELAYTIFDEDSNLLDQHESLIDPEMHIPSGASAANGITDDMVADAPTLEQYLTIVKQNPLMFDEPGIFIAHNAAFDHRYLGPLMHPETEVMCTLRLAKKLWPELDSHKLQALKYSLNLPKVEGDAHRAGADVEMLVNLVLHMMATTGLDIPGLLELAKAPLNIEKMTFGKHKGLALKDVPKDWFVWLLKQDNVDPDLAASIRKIHPTI